MSKRLLHTPDKYRASVWKEFGFQVETSGKLTDEKVVFCRHCDARVAYSGNTTNLSVHLKKCNAHLNKNSNQQQKLTCMYTPVVTKWKDNHPQASKITKAIVESVAKYLWPISTCEQLEDILKEACPSYNVLCRNTITTRIEELAGAKKSLLWDTLSEIDYVSLTTDFWTSISIQSFMGITIHFVDRHWELRTAGLEVHPTNDTHTAVNIASMLSEMQVSFLFCYHVYQLLITVDI